MEVTVGELLPDQPVPLLKTRLEIRHEEALKLWASKRKVGWHTTAPQWQLPGQSDQKNGDFIDRQVAK
ncbi:MAG: DUF1651 domain-containing protein [Cyanobium sp.]